MECNKDEALRAKQIAENRMLSGDFVGALKFATKAQKLFPDLQNIAQLLTVCEVHCAAQNKPSGSDMDWYGILQTERFADEATIKKQYRKLALLLHPDKNKSAGAEAAFKLIGEANRVLGDQTKRSLYDIRFRVPAGTTAPKAGNAGYNHNSFNSRSHTWNSHQRDEQQTFWTSCQHCGTRYQYYKTIVNATLRCQQCSKSFRAHDLGYHGVSQGSEAKSKSNGGKPCGRGQENKFGQSCSESMTKSTAGLGVYCKVEKSKDGHVAAGVTKAGIGTSNPATSKAKDSQTSTNVGSKRPRQSASDSRDDKKPGNDNDVKVTHVRENGVDPSGLNAGVHSRRPSRKKQHVSYAESAQDGDFDSSSKRRRRNESFNSTEVEKREVPESAGLFNNNNPASFTPGVSGRNGEVRNKASAPPEQSNVRTKEPSKSDLDHRKSKADNFSSLNSNSPSYTEICCPDPDFSDFEKVRAEGCFAANQFWALFDDTDCMPRFYALVKKVFSPFKVRFTWLEASSDDQGEIDWQGAGLPVGCGKFKLGKSQTTTNRAMFSHQIHCIKGSHKSCYLVYPKKGETWAIFRHWDIRWSSNPKKHSEYQFEYVQVLSDFDENVGITVAYLCKVKGFVSLFQQTVQNGISLFCVPPSELYRFSHRILSYKMAGDEREGVPKESFELDPAGLPNSLFEVVDPGDVKMEGGMLNNGVNCSGHESFECKDELLMSSESIHKAKLHKSNDTERLSSILRRSPRSNPKSMDNSLSSTSQYITREDEKDIGHGDYSQTEGVTAACQTYEGAKTPQKLDKNNYERETLKVRRSPRDLSKKNAQGDVGEWTTDGLTDNHSNAMKNVKDNNFSQSVGRAACLKKDCKVVGASCYDFQKKKSEEMFQCDQIWAIYGGRDDMPDIYAQIKKIEFTPNFRLYVSLLEPCAPPKGLRRTSCGAFEVKKAESLILSPSEFSHQLKVEPMTNNIYEIYPRKGEIWAVYKDQNYELTSSNRGRGECHIVEVLADSDEDIQVVVLMPLSSSRPIFKAPRIQRSKTGIIEILREEVGRFSHQIPAYQHSGEDVHLGGCWELDPSSVPGFFLRMD